MWFSFETWKISLTVHRLALNARVQLKVWLDPLFLSSSCSSKSRRKRILVSQQLSSHPPQNIFSLSTLVQGQLLSFFHSITGFFFFFNHCRFIYHLKWAYGFQFSFFQKWRMTSPPYDNLSFQMFRSSSTMYIQEEILPEKVHISSIKIFLVKYFLTVRNKQSARNDSK